MNHLSETSADGVVRRAKGILTIVTAWSLAAGVSVASVLAWGAPDPTGRPDTSAAPEVMVPRVHSDHSGRRPSGKASRRYVRFTDDSNSR